MKFEEKISMEKQKKKKQKSRKEKEQKSRRERKQKQKRATPHPLKKASKIPRLDFPYFFPRMLTAFPQDASPFFRMLTAFLRLKASAAEVFTDAEAEI